MTENEAKYYLLEHKPIVGFKTHNEALDVAINALSEIQQYRAIGTVEDIQLIFSLCKDLERMVKKYEAIGTVEEVRMLKEKSVARKIRGTRFEEAICPGCESELFDTYWAFGGIHYCSNCGQAIDWQ